MKYIACLLVLMSLVFLSGCTKSDGNVYVTGTVLLDDLPLAEAQVVFSPVNDSAGEGATGRTDEQGNFVLTTTTGKDGSGTKPGKYNVAVTKKNVEHTGRMIVRDGQDPVEDVIITDALPRVYGSPMTSPLPETIVSSNKDENVFKFELKSNP